MVHAPRALAAHGGVFFVTWAVVLVVWTLPLLMFEFALGRAARAGPIGAFVWVFGRRAAWRGGFLAVVAVALVAETAQRAASAFGGAARLATASEAAATNLAPAPWGAWAILAVALLAARRPVLNEGWYRRVVPAVFVVLVATAVWSWTRPGADVGLAALFDVEWSRLAEGGAWWDALVQASWSTGAGVGLMVLHARAAGRGMQARRESFATAFGVSIAGLSSALVVLPLLASSMPDVDWRARLAEGGEDLVSLVVPAFADSSTGRWVGMAYLTAVALASTTSVLAIVGLLARTARDRGMAATRGWLLAVVAAVVSLALWRAGGGAERWVWRVGLVVASGLTTLSVVGHGANRFWIELIGGPEGRFQGGGGFRFVAGVVLPLLVLVLLVGHLRGALAALGGDWSAWLSPWASPSLGACVLQWGAATVALKLALR